MARELREKEQLREALKITHNVIDKNPKSITANLLAGALYFDKLDYTQSCKYFKAVVNLDSTNELAHFNLGLTFMQLSHFDSALDCYNRILRLKGGGPLYFEPILQPNDMVNSQYNISIKELIYERARALFDLELFDLASVDFTNSINSSYELINSHFYRGYCYFNLNNFKDGCDDITYALKFGHKEALEVKKKYCKNITPPTTP